MCANTTIFWTLLFSTIDITTLKIILPFVFVTFCYYWILRPDRPFWSWLYLFLFFWGLWCLRSPLVGKNHISEFTTNNYQRWSSNFSHLSRSIELSVFFRNMLLDNTLNIKNILKYILKTSTTSFLATLYCEESGCASMYLVYLCLLFCSYQIQSANRSYNRQKMAPFSTCCGRAHTVQN